MKPRDPQTRTTGLADACARELGLPDNWRRLLTDAERALSGRWAAYGDDCVTKYGRGRWWDSHVPGAALFKTKREAYEFLTNFVTLALPFRCKMRDDQTTTGSQLPADEPDSVKENYGQ